MSKPKRKTLMFFGLQRSGIVISHESLVYDSEKPYDLLIFSRSYDPELIGKVSGLRVDVNRFGARILSGEVDVENSSPDDWYYSVELFPVSYKPMTISLVRRSNPIIESATLVAFAVLPKPSWDLGDR